MFRKNKNRNMGMCYAKQIINMFLGLGKGSGGCWRGEGRYFKV
jgi:hypothetical protein